MSDEKDQKSAPIQDASGAFEQAVAGAGAEFYLFKLYVAGSRRGSLQAIRRLKDLCETHLAGRYDLEIIDVYQQPERLAEADIVAVPTLIKHLPLPVQRFIGDLSDSESMLVRLAIHPK